MAKWEGSPPPPLEIQVKNTMREIVATAQAAFEGAPDVSEVTVEKKGIKVTFKRAGRTPVNELKVKE